MLTPSLVSPLVFNLSVFPLPLFLTKENEHLFQTSVWIPKYTQKPHTLLDPNAITIFCHILSQGGKIYQLIYQLFFTLTGSHIPQTITGTSLYLLHHLIPKPQLHCSLMPLRKMLLQGQPHLKPVPMVHFVLFQTELFYFYFSSRLVSQIVWVFCEKIC